jgi:hypothetical protein
MSGRGMAIVLVPNLSGKLVKTFTGHVTISGFLPVKPNYEFMTLLFRECKNTFFDFSQTHTCSIVTQNPLKLKHSPKHQSRLRLGETGFLNLRLH